MKVYAKQNKLRAKKGKYIETRGREKVTKLVNSNGQINKKRPNQKYEFDE